MPFVPGARLDGYELVSLLGLGGMGQVWLAQDVALGRKVALKLLPPELTSDALRLARFEQEARAVSALSHPNICHIYALGCTNEGQRYIAMELVQGDTLRARLQDARLSLPDILHVVTQAAAALSAAHAAQIIHRDLKPENVMVRADGLVKVLDFGLAKLAGTGGDAASEGSTRTILRTDAGTVVGTVAYMSPEQARAQEIDARTDIWSLGVLLYEMVAGCRPFTGKSSSDVLAAILDREPAPLARFDPDAPGELQRIINKALRKDREQRYQTAKDLMLDLETLRHDRAPAETNGSGAPAISRSTDAAADTPRIQHTPKYLILQTTRHKVAFAAGAFALLGLVGLVWWLRRPPREPETLSVREPEFIELTANPPGLGIGSAVISPNGRYVAYDDTSGIRVRLIDTGETQPLPDTKGMTVYGWRGDSTRVRASRCEAGTCIGWSISLVGTSRYRSDGTWPEGEVVYAMPGGSGLLGWTPRELTLHVADGSAPRVIARGTRAVAPSADGARVLVVKDNAIQSISAKGDASATIWKASPGLEIDGLVDLSNHRMFVVLRRPNMGGEVAPYELHTDSSGSVVGAPHRLTTHWLPGVMRSLSASSSADGQRVTFVHHNSQSDAYVADFDVESSTLTTPRRLTLDERYDAVTAWTPDSKSILYTSNRKKNPDIFSQRVDDSYSEVPLVLGPGDQALARVTSDGRWVLYL